MGMLKEFMDFLYEYKVIGLAIAFIIGVAATAREVIGWQHPDAGYHVLIPGGEWQTATLTIGPIVVSWGTFLADPISFIIAVLIVFIIAKNVLKEENVTKK